MQLDIGIDLDGCAYHFHEGLRRFAISEGYDPSRLVVDAFSEESTWDFYRDYWDMDAPEFIDLCRRGVDAGVVFLEGEPFPGAVETLQSIKAKGHFVHIITNRSLGTRVHHNTSDWLNKWEIPYDSLIFTGRKHLFGSLDLMIDDYEGNFNDFWGVGVETWLFDRAYNRHVDDRGYRVKNWSQFEDVVDTKALTS